MFEVNGRTIRLSRGDTGIIPFRTTGVTLTSEDRAVFTIRKKGGGTALVQKICAPEDESLFYVPFVNEETDGFTPGVYEWDLRIVLGAKTDAQGRVTDGREVITPWPPSTFEVVRVVGNV